MTSPAPDLPAQAPNGDLERLVQQLWPFPRDGDAVSVSLGAGAPPPGYRVVERYVALPTAATAKVLAPLGRPQRTRRALLSYNALRSPRTRAVRRLLGDAAGLRLTNPRARDRVTVSVRGSEVDAGGVHLLLTGHLQEALGVPFVALSPGVRPAAPNSKPTALMLDREGVPLGYVKVGWNPATDRMVANEARALRRLELSVPPGLEVPRVLHHGRWAGRTLLVTSPLPAGVRRLGTDRQLSSRITESVAGISGQRRHELLSSPYWDDVARREASVAATTTDVGLRGPLRSLLAALQDCASPVLRFGSWHGDWVPWNMARCGEQLAVWDWEHSSDDAPVGFDRLHFAFQVSFVLRRRTFSRAVADLDDAAAGLLRALDLQTSPRHLASLYLLEHVLRAAETARDGGGWNARLTSEVTSVLTTRSASPG